MKLMPHFFYCFVKAFSLLTLSLLGSISLYAQGQLEIKAVEDIIPLSEHLEILEDEKGEFQIEQLLQEQNPPSFQPFVSVPASLDPTRTWWLRLKVDHQLNHLHRWMLYTRAVGMAELYVVDSLGKYEMFRSGRNMPASKRSKIKETFYIFPFNLTLILLIHSTSKSGKLTTKPSNSIFPCKTRCTGEVKNISV